MNAESWRSRGGIVELREVALTFYSIVFKILKVPRLVPLFLFP